MTAFQVNYSIVSSFQDMTDLLLLMFKSSGCIYIIKLSGYYPDGRYYDHLSRYKL